MFLYAWLHLSGYARHDDRRDQALPAAALEDPRTPRAHARTERGRDDHGPARTGRRERRGHGRRRQDGRGALQHQRARDLRSPHRLPRRRRVHARRRGHGGGRVRGSPAARQPDSHLRLERRDARRDGEGDPERGHRQALRGHRLRRRRPSTGTRWTRSLAAFERAKKAGSGKPQLIIAKTLIGRGVPEVEGTQKAHGEAGAKFADAARKGLGLPAGAVLRLGAAVRAFFAERDKELDARLHGVDQDVRCLESKEPGAGRAARGRARLRVHAAERHRARTPGPSALFEAIPEFPADRRSRRERPGKTSCSRLPRRYPCSSAEAPTSTALR